MKHSQKNNWSKFVRKHWYIFVIVGGLLATYILMNTQDSGFNQFLNEYRTEEGLYIIKSDHQCTGGNGIIINDFLKEQPYDAKASIIGYTEILRLAFNSGEEIVPNLTFSQDCTQVGIVIAVGDEQFAFYTAGGFFIRSTGKIVPERTFDRYIVADDWGNLNIWRETSLPEGIMATYEVKDIVDQQRGRLVLYSGEVVGVVIFATDSSPEELYVEAGYGLWLKANMMQEFFQQA